MKKIFTFIICTIFLFSLTSCKQTEKTTIESNEWILSTIQSNEQNGDIIAYNPNDNTVIVPENAIIIELSCSAKDKVLTLLDETNNKTYTGEYKELDDNFESTIYEITINETQGTAVASTMEYNDGKEIPTLIITLGDYTLNFYSNASGGLWDEKC